MKRQTCSKLSTNCEISCLMREKFWPLILLIGCIKVLHMAHFDWIKKRMAAFLKIRAILCKNSLKKLEGFAKKKKTKCTWGFSKKFSLKIRK